MKLDWTKLELFRIYTKIEWSFGFSPKRNVLRKLKSRWVNLTFWLTRMLYSQLNLLCENILQLIVIDCLGELLVYIIGLDM